MATSSDGPVVVSLMTFVFSLLHVAVSVGVTYGTLALFLNKTRFQIVEGRFTVRHGPLPWSFARDLPIADIRQLYVRTRVSRGGGGSRSYSYVVHLETEGLESLKLVEGLRSEEEARYLEWVIEDHLGIDDEPR